MLTVRSYSAGLAQLVLRHGSVAALQHHALARLGLRFSIQVLQLSAQGMKRSGRMSKWDGRIAKQEQCRRSSRVADERSSLSQLLEAGVGKA
jgi:hypothetical protein